MGKITTKPRLLMGGLAALAVVGIAISTYQDPETKPLEDGSPPVVLGEPDAPTVETGSMMTYFDDVGNERYVGTGKRVTNGAEIPDHLRE